MIDTYQESGEKDWIEATVTIDGTTFEQVGLRLKGNSSLRGVDDGADPTELPWLVRLDEYVDGQALDGWTDFVVRSNNSETALNEAVALDLLAEAGLASEHAIATSFAVNGGDPTLRLVVQALDESWESENFATDGLLYKSEAGGDWTYRGTDPDSYTDVFDQETGDDDLSPLIDFLDFLNNSSDAEFARGLAARLDVEAFARYLAFEDLVGNTDDIDGPGNNSYLRYDATSGGFTVVAWDHNLAFGGMGGSGGGSAGPAASTGRAADGDRRRGCRPTGPDPRVPRRPGERPDGMPGGAAARRPWWVQRAGRALHGRRGVGRPRRAGEGRPDRVAVRERLRRRGDRPLGRRCSPSRPATSSMRTPWRRRRTPYARSSTRESVDGRELLHRLVGDLLHHVGVDASAEEPAGDGHAAAEAAQHLARRPRAGAGSRPPC